MDIQDNNPQNQQKFPKDFVSDPIHSKTKTKAKHKYFSNVQAKNFDGFPPLIPNNYRKIGILHTNDGGKSFIFPSNLNTEVTIYNKNQTMKILSEQFKQGKISIENMVETFNEFDENCQKQLRFYLTKSAIANVDQHINVFNTLYDPYNDISQVLKQILDIRQKYLSKFQEHEASIQIPLHNNNNFQAKKQETNNYQKIQNNMEVEEEDIFDQGFKEDTLPNASINNNIAIPQMNGNGVAQKNEKNSELKSFFTQNPGPQKKQQPQTPQVPTKQKQSKVSCLNFGQINQNKTLEDKKKFIVKYYKENVQPRYQDKVTIMHDKTDDYITFIQQILDQNYVFPDQKQKQRVEIKPIQAKKGLQFFSGYFYLHNILIFELIADNKKRAKQLVTLWAMCEMFPELIKKLKLKQETIYTEIKNQKQSYDDFNREIEIQEENELDFFSNHDLDNPNNDTEPGKFTLEDDEAPQSRQSFQNDDADPFSLFQNNNNKSINNNSLSFNNNNNENSNANKFNFSQENLNFTIQNQQGLEDIIDNNVPVLDFDFPEEKFDENNNNKNVEQREKTQNIQNQKINDTQVNQSPQKNIENSNNIDQNMEIEQVDVHDFHVPELDKGQSNTGESCQIQCSSLKELENVAKDLKKAFNSSMHAFFLSRILSWVKEKQDKRLQIILSKFTRIGRICDKELKIEILIKPGVKEQNFQNMGVDINYLNPVTEKKVQWLHDNSVQSSDIAQKIECYIKAFKTIYAKMKQSDPKGKKSRKGRKPQIVLQEQAVEEKKVTFKNFFDVITEAIDNKYLEKIDEKEQPEFSHKKFNKQDPIEVISSDEEQKIIEERKNGSKNVLISMEKNYEKIKQDELMQKEMKQKARGRTPKLSNSSSNGKDIVKKSITQQRRPDKTVDGQNFMNHNSRDSRSNITSSNSPDISKDIGSLKRKPQSISEKKTHKIRNKLAINDDDEEGFGKEKEVQFQGIKLKKKEPESQNEKKRKVQEPDYFVISSDED